MLPPNTAEYQRTRRDPKKEPTWKNAPDDLSIPEPPPKARTTGFKGPRQIDTMAIPDFLQRQRNAPEQPAEHPQPGQPLSHKTVDQVFAALAPMLLASGTATVR